ncbi:MAG TPA: epoxyqueuosine reductase QueH, partial [Ruminococcus bromii]|nr:epoxyqueuosine reductase QueH [Ruminococcus bromii]
MNKINYQKELDRVIEKITEEGKVPKLLLHVCCAPCSSYCLEYLSKYFDIT